MQYSDRDERKELLTRINKLQEQLKAKSDKLRVEREKLKSLKDSVKRWRHTWETSEGDAWKYGHLRREIISMMKEAMK